MTRLLCTGDFHIGAGSEYGRKPGDRLRDQAQVCQRIADLASERNVDGILLAGDLLNGPAAAPEHLAVLADFVASAPCPVLTITGNGSHDLAMRDVNGLAILDRIPGITVSSTPGVYEFAGCAVATLPWVSPARLVASRNGGDRDELHADVARMLIEIAERGKQDCERVAPGAPHVLLAHWSVSGSSLPNGLSVDQLREPVIPLADLEEIGYDAIVLGHIHKAQGLGRAHDRHLLFDEGEEHVTYGNAAQFYVGSPMPLNFGEADGAHGVWIIAPDEHGPAGGMPSEFVPIPSRPFVTLDFKHEDAGAQIALSRSIGWDIDEGAIVRVRYTATAEQARSIDHAQIRQELLDAGAAVVKIVPEIIRQDRARVTGLDEQVSELEALEQWMVSQGIASADDPWGDTRLADAMRERTAAYLEAVA